MPDKCEKKEVLVLGGGGVGALAALNLEAGGKAVVTMVLRSNYKKVSNDGYKIMSMDHGRLSSWRPTNGLVQSPR